MIIKDINDDVKINVKNEYIMSVNVDLRDIGEYRRIWVHLSNNSGYDILFKKDDVDYIIKNFFKLKEIKESGDWNLIKFEDKVDTAEQEKAVQQE